MTKSLLTAAASALVAAGCGNNAAGPVGGNVAPPAPAEGAKQAPVPPSADRTDPQPIGDAMRWNFSRTAAGPKLAYGEPATDNVRLMMRCPPGGDSVILSFQRPEQAMEAQPADLTVEAGAEAYRAPADISDSQIGGMAVSAQAPATAAPLARFRAGSPLTVHWGDVVVSVPAGAEHQAAIAGFFDACRPS